MSLFLNNNSESDCRLQRPDILPRKPQGVVEAVRVLFEAISVFIEAVRVLVKALRALSRLEHYQGHVKLL
jgi:hypothetical protein